MPNMFKHENQSEFFDKTITIKSGKFTGESYHVEDWWDRVGGGSWMDAIGNAACLAYASRTGFHDKVPVDDEVLYGKINGMGHLIHVSEVSVNA